MICPNCNHKFQYVHRKNTSQVKQTCSVCKKEYVKSRVTKYCSYDCRQKAYILRLASRISEN